MQKRNYDHAEAAKLDSYVRKHYRDRITNGQYHVYQGIAYLEQTKGQVVGKNMAVGHRDIARAAWTNVKTVGPALRAMNGVLLDVKMGSDIKGEKAATIIRRYKLHELRKPAEKAQSDAERLAAQLAGRDIGMEGEGALRPLWSVGISEKLVSSNPCLHSMKASERVRIMSTALNDGEVLYMADICAAEPAVINHELGYPAGGDPYMDLAKIAGSSREAAKGAVHKLNYSPVPPTKAIQSWPPEARAAFQEYAEKLEAYRAELWTKGKARSGKPRSVTTLSGRVIQKPRGAKQPHPGSVLAWQAGGTIADIINRVCLDIMDREPSRPLTLIMPLYDAVYARGEPGQEGTLESMITETAAALCGLPVSVEVKTYVDAVPKTEQQTGAEPVPKTEPLTSL